MNSFVCDEDYDKAAAALDYRRLGKQRVECYQMLAALTGRAVGWRNHPATRAWEGHEKSLAEFAIACHIEWLERGYKDTTLGRMRELAAELPDTDKPWWVSDERWLTNIRGILVMKRPSHYSVHWPTCEPTSKQLWPVPNDSGKFMVRALRGRMVVLEDAQ